MTEIPDDIPSDVVALARKYSMNDDVLVGVCRAILAERERWSAEIKRLTSESSPYMVGFEDGWEAAIGEPPENNS